MSEGGPIVLSDGEIDLVRRVVRRADRTTVLTPTEAALVERLARSAGEVVSRDALEASGFTARCADRTVHRLRAKIERDPGSPDHLITVYQVGYRLVPAGAGPSPARTNLVPPRTALLGRDALVDEVEVALRTRSVVLVGPGGVGKTRLAEEIARRAAESWAVGGAWRVDLADPQPVAPAVARALRLDVPGSTAHVLRAAAAALRIGGPTLLILDDADRAEDDLAAVVDALGVRVLCTARREIALPGARAVPVPPLPLPAAVRLFVARASDLGWSPPDDLDALERIARATDRLPLALELAASRVRSLSPGALATALEQHQLRVLRRPGGGRHASLEATLAWSWDALDPDQQRTLAGAAVFGGPFDRDLADAVVVPGGADAVRALTRWNLVWDEGGRLRVPAAVRELARSRSPDPDAERRWVGAIAERVRAWLGPPRVAGCLTRLLTVATELRAAIGSAWPADPAAAATLICGAVMLDERAFGVERLRAVGDALPGGDLRVRIRLLELWEWGACGRWDRAGAVAAEAAAEAELAGAVVQGEVRAARVACLAQSGRTGEALDAARQALEAAGTDPAVRIRAAGVLGGAAMTAGRWEEARAALEEAVDLARKHGSPLLAPWLVNLAGCRFRVGAPELAREALDEALGDYRFHRDGRGIGVVAHTRAWASLELGRYEEAITGFDEAADRLRDAGETGWGAWSRAVAGAARALADPEDPGDARSECAAAAAEVSGNLPPARSETGSATARAGCPVPESRGSGAGRPVGREGRHRSVDRGSGDRAVHVRAVYAAVLARAGDRAEAARVLDAMGDELATALHASPDEVAGLHAWCAGGPPPARATADGPAAEAWAVIGWLARSG